MARRRLTVPAGAVLVAALVGGLVLVEPRMRELALSSAAAASLRSTGVPVAGLDSPTSTGPTIYLVVGSDRRPVRNDSVRDIRSERADAIMLWAVGHEGPTIVVSLPRDLRVQIPGHGDQKLAGSLEYGPAAVVASVRSATGIRIHHYVELEFTALTRIVDAVGGIGIDLPRPARDLASGLSLPAGHHDLTGREALAYMRSRTYEELQGTVWVTDGKGDIGRIARQQQLLLRAVHRLSGCGILTCLALAPDIHRFVTVDLGLDASDVEQLVAAVAGEDASVSAYILPTRPERSAADSVSPFPPAHSGNVGYRRMEEPASRVVLRRLLEPALPATPAG